MNRARCEALLRISFSLLIVAVVCVRVSSQDFNGDGTFDCTDLAVLTDAIVTQSQDPQFDFNCHLPTCLGTSEATRDRAVETTNPTSADKARRIRSRLLL